MKSIFRTVIFCSLIPLSVYAVEYIDDAERLKPVWQQLDANADGVVETGELHPVLAGAIKRSDRDGDGRISLEEYVQFDLDPGGSAFLPLAENVHLVENIPYASSNDPRQQLDVYLPKKAAVEGPLPVIAYVHGGAFKQGSKVMARSQIMSLVDSGRYAAVSIAYRLSWQSTWPAQIHDVKAAIRWIKANAEDYGFDATRVCALGPSAGGHLVAMLGTTNGVEAVEGSLGENLDYSSDVHCTIDYFGPTDMRTIRPERAGDGVVAALLGGPVSEKQELAAQASPILYVDKNDPPFFIIHGTEDPLVDYFESVNLEEALREKGVPVWFQTIEGGGHGNFGAAIGELERRVRAFLELQFYSAKTELQTSTLQANPSN